ncbi:hypothetical protein QJS66_11160 [Kocuria rhizophila]|nr:hypothetical protein QJS66_11160 [Kocuria rhizophila]
MMDWVARWCGLFLGSGRAWPRGGPDPCLLRGGGRPGADHVDDRRALRREPPTSGASTTRRTPRPAAGTPWAGCNLAQSRS